MKKLFALILALTMLTALTACGKKDTTTEETQKPAVEETKPEDTTTETEVETKTEVEEETTAPETEVEEETTAPETETETEDAPAAEGLNAFVESVAAANSENWPMMMPLDSEALGAFYAGLGDIATKDCVVYMPMMSSVVCEIALVEVENEADVQAVKDIFQARINYQVGNETNPGGAWYPESIEGWKNNSRIVSNGNLVMMIAYSECDTVVEMFNAL